MITFVAAATGGIRKINAVKRNIHHAKGENSVNIKEYMANKKEVENARKRKNKRRTAKRTTNRKS